MTRLAVAGTVNDMDSLWGSLAMLAMIVAGASVIAYVLRNRLDAPDLPSERSSEMSRAEAQASGERSAMGPQ